MGKDVRDALGSLYNKVTLKRDARNNIDQDLFNTKINEYGIILGYIDERGRRVDEPTRATCKIVDVILAVKEKTWRKNKLKRYIRADWTQFRLFSNKIGTANKEPKLRKRRNVFGDAAQRIIDGIPGAGEQLQDANVRPEEIVRRRPSVPRNPPPPLA